MRRAASIPILMLAAALPLAAETPVIPLAGTWHFRLDAEQMGHQLNWQLQRFDSDVIFLPGSTDQAGYGLRTAGPEKGWLSRPYFYEGPAWYQRNVTIPETWKGKRIALILERPHWQTEVWVDGKAQGKQNSLATPHLYDLGMSLAPGEHRITICVDNTYRIDVGRNAHSVTEHTQTNWNGIVGRIELRATDPVWIDSVWIESSATTKSAKVKAKIRNETGAPQRAVISAGSARAEVDVPETAKDIELSVPMGAAAKLWDEYEPNLQRLVLTLTAGAYRDEWRGMFGLRDIGSRDSQFILNGRPVFLRGTLECNIFPLSGFPPMDIEGWARLFRIARSYGLNHFRFHSWCPPEAAFQAADEAGFLLHVELPVWNRTIGKDPALIEFMRAEGQRMQKTYGNHPSFTMMCLGNELAGDRDLMDQMVGDFRQRDPRRLYTFSADYERLVPGLTSDYYVAQRTKGGPLRIHGSRFDKENSSTDFDFSDRIQGITVPVVAHELGQWVTFPDYAEIGKYTGVLKPRNLEAFRAQLEARGMLDLSKQFQLASGRFAWLLYKEEVETALRTPHFGGVQLLQLQDFPGQGEALIGLLDSFWETKGILRPEQMRGFFGETVPLARFSKYIWTNDESFAAKIQLANYGKADLPQAVVEWRITGPDGKELTTGKTNTVSVSRGQVANMGEIRASLATVMKASQLKLETRLKGSDTTNTWDIWVYPKDGGSANAGDVLLTGAFDAASKQRLASGGKVLLSWPAGRAGKSTIASQFLPVFWSLTWFPRQPGTLGILCDPTHPAFASFPTDFHSNFQWYELTQNAPAFVLDDTPASFRPLVMWIDDYHRNHKLGAVFELKAGRGKLLVSAFNLETDLSSRPAARQLRKSLLDYMNSPQFNPAIELDGGALANLLVPEDRP